ncbi:VOC family protein [Nonomuraea sp. NPDC049141]|uniref:VOC family protein n=1 Tax=unclassified Nonomuraea TaxID=2593643 RepID=UPI0033F91526
MDVLHPRLLVSAFAECFAFYDAVLPEVLGANLAKGGPDGPYAHWDVGSEGVLSMLDRGFMSEIAGTGALPANAVAQDHVMLVSRVADVDRAYAICLAHGGRSVAEPADRPGWGLRAAHVRDPEGNLVEFQSY